MLDLLLSHIFRTFEHLLGRITGPLKFRLVLQPTVATILAIRAGLNDCRKNRPAYFWTILWNPAERQVLIRGGWKDIVVLFVAACVLDLIYQLLALHWFYPLQCLLVAVFLAIIPYLLIRGPTNRIALWITGRAPHPTGKSHDAT
jgi:hypothetical protein